MKPFLLIFVILLLTSCSAKSIKTASSMADTTYVEQKKKTEITLSIKREQKRLKQEESIRGISSTEIIFGLIIIFFTLPYVLPK